MRASVSISKSFEDQKNKQQDIGLLVKKVEKKKTREGDAETTDDDDNQLKQKLERFFSQNTPLSETFTQVCFHTSLFHPFDVRQTKK